MSHQSPASAADTEPAGSPRSAITERGVLVRGVRVAVAMSDAPRAFLARVPVVVLPEAGFVWQDYRVVLDRYAPERRVFALDWPGFGASARPTPGEYPYTVAALTETFAGWLDGLGIARAVLVANGIGAAVALRYAVAHPKRVLGLALLAPVGFPGDTRMGRMLTRLLGSRTTLSRFEGLATSLALGPTTEATQAVAERHRALRGSAERAASAAALAVLWRDASRATDLPTLARRVSAPAQVYRGALDPLVTAAESRRAAEDLGERGALEVTLPEAGHLPFLQQPERFFQALTGLVNTAELAAAQLS